MKKNVNTNANNVNTDVNNAENVNTDVNTDVNFQLKTDRAYVYLIVGRPGSGKTHCLKSIMYDFAKMGHFKFGIVYTQNKMNSDLDFVPEKSIHDDLTEEKLQEYISKMMKYREKTKKELPPSFMIFEDMIGSKNLNLYSDVVSKLLILHRHLNISIFFLSQYLGGKSASSTLLREVTNYAIIFNTRFLNSKEFLFKSCGQHFKKADEFYDLLDRATAEKHRALLYDSSKDRIEEAYHT